MPGDIRTRTRRLGQSRVSRQTAFKCSSAPSPNTAEERLESDALKPGAQADTRKGQWNGLHPGCVRFRCPEFMPSAWVALRGHSLRALNPRRSLQKVEKPRARKGLALERGRGLYFTLKLSDREACY